MTAPVVAGSALSGDSTNVTAHVVDLPASIAAGDLVIVYVALDSGALSATIPSPWVEIKDEAGTGFVAYVAYLIASGGETSVTVTSAAAEHGNHIALRITGWHGTTPPEITTAVTGSSTTPDPPSITASWGSADNLFIAVLFSDQGTGSAPFPVTAWPTNYGNDHIENAVDTSAAVVAVATRALTGATDDPGTFTMTSTETWSAYSMVVRPGAGASPQTVDLGLIDRTATIAAPIVFGGNLTLGLITVSTSVFSPVITTTRTVTLGLIDQTAVPYAPVIATTGAQAVTLGFINQTAVITSLTGVANSTPVTLGLIDRTATIFNAAVTATYPVTLGRIDQTAAVSALIVDLGAAPFVSGTPRNRTGAVEYVIEISDSGATFGPNVKLGEIWDARNLGWSAYDRLPGKGFLTLPQTSPTLALITPLLTHVAIYRCTYLADTLVFRGIAYDFNSTGDDVIVELFDYKSLLALSRSGFKTMYPTKQIGTQIASPEWTAAKGAASSVLGFVTTGTIQDPLGTDGVTPIKTNAQFGTLDQNRLQLFYDLAEMGRANTANQTTFEIDLTNTFNFWKNQGSQSSTVAFVLGGNVSDYQWLPNWKRYRNNLATLGVATTGGPSEITSNNASEVTAKGLRQDVTVLKTLAGIAGLTTEADQQKAALDRQLKTLTQQEGTLGLRLARGRFEPRVGLDINDTAPIEIGNGIDTLTGNRRLLGLRVKYSEIGEDINAVVGVIAT